MSEGAIAGRYNVVVTGQYETFERQVPVEDFIETLQQGQVPREVSVVGLGEAFEDGSLVDALAVEIDRSGDDLENARPRPTIQFVVENQPHRHEESFDLPHGEDLYPLRRVFGPQLEREDDGWLVAPF